MSCIHARSPIILRPEFDEGDEVLVRIRERGMLKAVCMRIVKAELRGGRWVYQVMKSGETDLYIDARGNSWFREDDLDWGSGMTSSPEYTRPQEDATQRGSTQSNPGPLDSSNSTFHDEWCQALNHRDVGRVESLIKKGLDINAPIVFVDHKGRSVSSLPLAMAAMSSPATTELVLNAGASVDATFSFSGTALQQAIADGPEDTKHDIVRLLLRHGADVNATAGASGTALIAAVVAKDQLMVTLLLENGANVNQLDGRNYGTALTTAAEVADCYTLKPLLDREADPNAPDRHGPGNALLHAIGRSDGAMVRLLLEHGADCNVKIYPGPSGDWPLLAGPPLVAAAIQGIPAVILALLEYGADVDLQSESHGPPVIAAAFSGQTRAALLLLEHGADPSRADNWWQHRLNTRKKDAGAIPMPKYLKLWQKASLRQDYRSINDLVEDISGTDLEVSFDCLVWEWELPAAIALDNVDGGLDYESLSPSVNEHVVLLSSDALTSAGDVTKHIEATTCFEYLTRRWKDSCSGFISGLGNLLSEANLNAAESGGFNVCANNDPLISLTCDRSTVSIHFNNGIDLGTASPLIEALDWLCKAIRVPSTDYRFAFSTATYQLLRCEISKSAFGDHQAFGQESRRYMLRPCITLRTFPLPELQHNCWQLLFDSCYIVDCGGAPQPHSHLGNGLEISFDLMISLAAAEFYLSIQGGIIFVGYQTVLIPTMIEGNYAQFHLMTKEKGQINPYKLDLGQRALVEDPSQFKKMRCFLGWCKAAQINLGTEQLPAKVRYSGGRDKGKIINLDGVSLSLQVGPSSPLSALLGLQTNFKYKSHRPQFTPFGGYCKLLQDTARELAIIYDAGDQRCWLVPKLSLLLHMSHAHELCCVNVPGDRVPFVEPHHDAVEIIKALGSLGGTIIYGLEGDALLLRQLMLGLNINLLECVSSIEQSGGKNIYGFEFMDAVTQPGRGSCMKKLEILPQGRNWLDIVNEVDAVVVCSGLGEAITAVERQDRKCLQCNLLPKRSDYLAVPLSCLSRLAERRGEELKLINKSYRIKISDGGFWSPVGDPFEECLHDKGSSRTCWERSEIFQHLVIQKRFKLSVSLRDPQESSLQSLPLSGAVVFGERHC